MHWRLTGNLLDLVDHHKGVGQAHFDGVIDGTDLRHLNRNLEKAEDKNHSDVSGLKRDPNQKHFIDPEGSSVWKCQQ